MTHHGGSEDGRGLALVDQMSTTLTRMLVDAGMTHDAADQIATDYVNDIAFQFGGLQFYIPKGHLGRLSKRDEAMYAEFNGRNHIDLAVKHKITVARVYQIVKAKLAEERARRQRRLFDDTPEESKR